MKKLLIFLLFISTPALAQYTNEDFRQSDKKSLSGNTEAKQIATEVQFNPFDNNGNTFKLDGLKLRFFLSDVDALRVKVGFSLSSKTSRDDLLEPIRDNYSSASSYSSAMDVYEHKKEDYGKSSHSSISLNLGYERHFFANDNISLYAGAQVGGELNFASYKSESNRQVSLASNRSTWITETVKFSNSDKDGNYGGLTIGGGVFTGIDYYLTENLYLGAELGLSARYFKAKDVKQDYEVWDSGSERMISGSINTNVKNSSFEAKIYIEPSFRLGWKF